MRQFIPEHVVDKYEDKIKAVTLTDEEIDKEKRHKKLLDYIRTLPDGLMGNSPGDYQETGFFIIEMDSWMKSKNAEVDMLKSCIERHNIQAEEQLNKVKSNE